MFKYMRLFSTQNKAKKTTEFLIEWGLAKSYPLEWKNKSLFVHFFRSSTKKKMDSIRIVYFCFLF